MDPADLLRAVRYARRLSQRDLARLADLPPSTIDRIEARQTRDPGFGTIQQVLAAAGYILVGINEHGRPLRIEPERYPHVDRGGRRFPAHLPWNAVRSRYQGCDADWWGWGKIAWSLSDPVVPKYTFRKRYEAYPDPYGDYRWNAAT